MVIPAGVLLSVAQSSDGDGEDFSSLLVFLLKAIGVLLAVAAGLVILSLVLMVPFLHVAWWLRLKFDDRSSSDGDGS